MKRMLALILVIICMTCMLPMQSVTAEEFSDWVGTASDIYQDAEVVGTEEAEPLYMYDIPAVTGNRLLILYEGDVVFVLRDNDQFAEVIYAEQIGYVQSSMLRLIDGTINPASDTAFLSEPAGDGPDPVYEIPDNFDPTYGLRFGMTDEEIESILSERCEILNHIEFWWTFRGSFFGIPATIGEVSKFDDNLWFSILFYSEDSDLDREAWPEPRLKNIDLACDCLKQAIISKLGQPTQSQHIGDTVYWKTDDYLLLLSDTRYIKSFMMIEVIIGDYSYQFENSYK